MTDTDGRGRRTEDGFRRAPGRVLAISLSQRVSQAGVQGLTKATTISLPLWSRSENRNFGRRTARCVTLASRPSTTSTGTSSPLSALAVKPAKSTPRRLTGSPIAA